ncbi:MAG: hypothetical protein JWM97_2006 [Phycisphaerales bacterium]|nr:hypothetical protein [Phycisphaerales bacterium]
MEKPEPLPYAATARARKNRALPIVAFTTGATAIVFYVIAQMVVRYVPIQRSMTSPGTVIYFVTGIGSQILGYVAVATSAVAFLRRGSLLTRLSVIFAIVYWALILMAGFPRYR